MLEAAKIGDLFITATGNTGVVTAAHMGLMKDKAILCNVGDYDVEVRVKELERIAVARKKVRTEVTEYRLKSGKRLYLLSDGRLVNLAAADGHPAEVMDMSFAGQALSAEYLLGHGSKLESKLIRVPEELDLPIARWRLEEFGKRIDSLTRVQKNYARSWRLWACRPPTCTAPHSPVPSRRSRRLSSTE